MLNQELMKKWIAALRSDKYSQCTGVLHKADGSFCALGVLEDVAQHGSTWVRHGSCYYADGESGLMPSVRTINALGEMPSMLEVRADLPVWEANDSGWPFSEIADALEANYITPNKDYHEREASQASAQDDPRGQPARSGTCTAEEVQG